jgi:hypothetical protein
MRRDFYASHSTVCGKASVSNCVGAVNRHFRISYLALFSACTSYEHVMSMEQAHLCLNDTAGPSRHRDALAVADISSE